MNTTLVFAELIVVGVEGMIWVILLVLTLFGNTPIKNTLTFFKGWEPGVYFILLSLTYVLGVLLDRFADGRFEDTEDKILDDTVGDLAEDFVVIRYSLGKQNEYLNQQLEYTRTRVRIVRASALNFPLIAIFASTFIYFRSEIDTTMQAIYIASIAAIGIASYYIGKHAWETLQKNHLELARKMYIYEAQNDARKTKRPKKKKALRKELAGTEK